MTTIKVSVHGIEFTKSDIPLVDKTRGDTWISIKEALFCYQIERLDRAHRGDIFSHCIEIVINSRDI